jgi:hypothetical protein
MTPLPQPDDLTSLVLRTDFSDETAWEELKAALDELGDRDATCVSDPAFDGVTVQALIDADAAAGEDEQLTYVFLADDTTMTDVEHPLLLVDLHDEPGRHFRVPPRWFPEISANLCIANVDFYEFADVADRSGTYRGLGKPSR